MSQIEVDKIIPQSGTSTQLGESGDTITIPAGATITNNGTANGFGSADTEKVKVSSNDTTAGFLNGKLVAGTNISLTEGSDGGNETLTAAFNGNLNASVINAGTIATARLGSGTASSSTFLRGDQTYAAAGGGKINQVLQTTSTSAQTINSSTSFVDITNMTLAITPSATSSKIYVIINLKYDLGSTDRGFQIKILRDSTAVFSETSNASTYSSASRIKGRNFYDKLDSPSTTSQITYKVQAQTDSGGGVTFQENSNPSSIILMEVLA